MKTPRTPQDWAEAYRIQAKRRAQQARARREAKPVDNRIHPLILHPSNAHAAQEAEQRVVEARRAEEERGRSPHPMTHGPLSRVGTPQRKYTP